MDGQILDTISTWETVPVDDGAAGLDDLVGREFSGVVTDGAAWLFLLNGRGVGVTDGDAEDFADAGLTARRAPDDALPLLYAMMSNGAETRAKYYTEDTPLSAAHETLESGGFTGFVELSENVLSGDYYVVYYGGRSLPVAFVGAAETMLTGDEAFERADDEVGIYHVREASVSILDLPTAGGTVDEADETGTAEGASDERTTGHAGEDVTVAAESTADDAAVDDDAPADVGTPAKSVDGAEGSGTRSYDFDATAALGGEDSTSGESSTPGDDAGPSRSVGDDGGDDAGGGATTASPDVDLDEGTDPATGADVEAAADADGSEASAEPPTEGPGVGDDDANPDANAASAGSDDGAASVDAVDVDEAVESVVEEAAGATDVGDAEAESVSPADAKSADDDETTGVTIADTDGDPLADETVYDEEAQWRDTQVIPPLSPEDEGESDVAVAESRAKSGESQAAATSDDRNAALSELRERLQRVDAAREAAEERVEAVEAERDELADERDELAAEAERLRERVESLEAEVAELEATVDRLENGAAEPSTASMAADSALAGTSLFVRYDTKGGPTLEKAHDEGADRQAVNGNLRLEYHTTFESESMSVDGEDFETFLYDTTEYEFARWLVEEFIYELQDTGNTGSMKDLYDVLPDVDRIEFGGSVSLQYTEDGKEHREQRTFDVVVRDRLGNALAVADINATREATTEGELISLVEGTRNLAETSDTLAAAFAVTASFFDPSALEVAAEATSSGLLGRSKSKSYVKLSRKRGFHLCLVESRHGQFHVNVPEL
jgi:hypothetical protein